MTGERVSVRDLPIHFQEVNDGIADSVVTALNPEHDYFICFDQLDLGFSVTDPTYGERLIGLILAARELGQRAREADRRMSVIVFLRDDIYDLLQFEDKNKITENHLSSISWSQSSGDFTLKSLMERRFSVALEENARWEEVFDEERQMPSRQTKYAHICDRTFLRPRDIIKFCNVILTAHKERVGGERDLFRNDDLHAARNQYSEYLLSELDDEIHKHVPEYREYLEVLKTLGKTEFSQREFEETWTSRAILREADAPATVGLRELFEFSVIGYLKPGGRGGGSKYVWRYFDPRARFNDDADTYRIHPGLKEALDLRTSRAR